MNCTTISADIISYTSLTDNTKRMIETNIKQLLSDLSEKYSQQGFYGRMVQGDFIECAMNSPTYGLRTALLLKTYIKSLKIENNKKNESTRIKYFKEHAIRIAVAVAPLSVLKKEEGIIDGKAIYMSGRAIKDMTTSDKQKIVIKNTMYFCNEIEELQENFETIFSLLDTIISKCSGKQSEVLYLKLLGMNEKEISKKLLRLQSTISQHSSAAGWNAIEKSVNYYEKYIR